MISKLLHFLMGYNLSKATSVKNYDLQKTINNAFVYGWQILDRGWIATCQECFGEFLHGPGSYKIPSDRYPY